MEKSLKNKKLIVDISTCLLGILLVSNIVIGIESFTPPMLLLLATVSNYCDLSIVVIENLVVQLALILTLKIVRKGINVDRPSVWISNMLTWLCFAIYYIKVNEGNGIYDLHGSSMMTKVYSFSENLSGMSPYILYTVILLIIEFLIYLCLRNILNVENKKIKIGLACIYAVSIITLIFRGDEIEASFSAQIRTHPVKEAGLNVKVERFTEDELYICISKEKSQSSEDTTEIIFKPRTKDEPFFIDYKNDSLFMCSHMYKFEVKKEGTIKTSDNCTKTGKSEEFLKTPFLQITIEPYPLYIWHTLKVYTISNQ